MAEGMPEWVSELEHELGVKASVTSNKASRITSASTSYSFALPDVEFAVSVDSDGHVTITMRADEDGTYDRLARFTDGEVDRLAGRAAAVLETWRACKTEFDAVVASEDGKTLVRHDADVGGMMMNVQVRGKFMIVGLFEVMPDNHEWYVHYLGRKRMYETAAEAFREAVSVLETGELRESSSVTEAFSAPAWAESLARALGTPARMGDSKGWVTFFLRGSVDDRVQVTVNRRAGYVKCRRHTPDDPTGERWRIEIEVSAERLDDQVLGVIEKWQALVEHGERAVAMIPFECYVDDFSITPETDVVDYPPHLRYIVLRLYDVSLDDHEWIVRYRMSMADSIEQKRFDSVEDAVRFFVDMFTKDPASQLDEGSSIPSWAIELGQELGAQPTVMSMTPGDDQIRYATHDALIIVHEWEGEHENLEVIFSDLTKSDYACRFEVPREPDRLVGRVMGAMEKWHALKQEFIDAVARCRIKPKSYHELAATVEIDRVYHVVGISHWPTMEGHSWEHSARRQVLGTFESAAEAIESVNEAAKGVLALAEAKKVPKWAKELGEHLRVMPVESSTGGWAFMAEEAFINVNEFKKASTQLPFSMEYEPRHQMQTPWNNSQITVWLPGADLNHEVDAAMEKCSALIDEFEDAAAAFKEAHQDVRLARGPMMYVLHRGGEANRVGLHPVLVKFDDHKWFTYVNSREVKFDTAAEAFAASVTDLKIDVAITEAFKHKYEYQYEYDWISDVCSAVGDDPDLIDERDYVTVAHWYNVTPTTNLKVEQLTTGTTSMRKKSDPLGVSLTDNRNDAWRTDARFEIDDNLIDRIAGYVEFHEALKQAMLQTGWSPAHRIFGIQKEVLGRKMKIVLQVMNEGFDHVTFNCSCKHGMRLTQSYEVKYNGDVSQIAEMCKQLEDRSFQKVDEAKRGAPKAPKAIAEMAAHFGTQPQPGAGQNSWYVGLGDMNIAHIAGDEVVTGIRLSRNSEAGGALIEGDERVLMTRIHTDSLTSQRLIAMTEIWLGACSQLDGVKKGSMWREAQNLGVIAKSTVRGIAATCHVHFKVEDVDDVQWLMSIESVEEGVTKYGDYEFFDTLAEAMKRGDEWLANPVIDEPVNEAAKPKPTATGQVARAALASMAASGLKVKTYDDSKTNTLIGFFENETVSVYVSYMPGSRGKLRLNSSNKGFWRTDELSLAYDSVGFETSVLPPLSDLPEKLSTYADMCGALIREINEALSEALQSDDARELTLEQRPVGMVRATPFPNATDTFKVMLNGFEAEYVVSEQFGENRRTFHSAREAIEELVKRQVAHRNQPLAESVAKKKPSWYHDIAEEYGAGTVEESGKIVWRIGGSTLIVSEDPGKDVTAVIYDGDWTRTWLLELVCLDLKAAGGKIVGMVEMRNAIKARMVAQMQRGGDWGVGEYYFGARKPLVRGRNNQGYVSVTVSIEDGDADMSIKIESVANDMHGYVRIEEFDGTQVEDAFDAAARMEKELYAARARGEINEGGKHEIKLWVPESVDRFSVKLPEPKPKKKLKPVDATKLIEGVFSESKDLPKWVNDCAVKFPDSDVMALSTSMQSYDIMTDDTSIQMSIWPDKSIMVTIRATSLEEKQALSLYFDKNDRLPDRVRGMYDMRKSMIDGLDSAMSAAGIGYKKMLHIGAITDFGSITLVMNSLDDAEWHVDVPGQAESVCQTVGEAVAILADRKASNQIAITEDNKMPAWAIELGNELGVAPAFEKYEYSRKPTITYRLDSCIVFVTPDGNKRHVAIYSYAEEKKRLAISLDVLGDERFADRVVGLIDLRMAIIREANEVAEKYGFTLTPRLDLLSWDISGEGTKHTKMSAYVESVDSYSYAITHEYFQFDAETADEVFQKLVKFIEQDKLDQLNESKLEDLPNWLKDVSNGIKFTDVHPYSNRLGAFFYFEDEEGQRSTLRASRRGNDRGYQYSLNIFSSRTAEWIIDFKFNDNKSMSERASACVWLWKHLRKEVSEIDTSEYEMGPAFTWYSRSRNVFVELKLVALDDYSWQVSIKDDIAGNYDTAEEAFASVDSALKEAASKQPSWVQRVAAAVAAEHGSCEVLGLFATWWHFSVKDGQGTINLSLQKSRGMCWVSMTYGDPQGWAADLEIDDDSARLPSRVSSMIDLYKSLKAEVIHGQDALMKAGAKRRHFTWHSTGGVVILMLNLEALDSYEWVSYSDGTYETRKAHATFAEAAERAMEYVRVDHEDLFERVSLKSVYKALGVKPKDRDDDTKTFMFGNGFMVEIKTIEKRKFDVTVMSQNNGGITVKDMPLDDVDRCVMRITAMSEILQHIIDEGTAAIGSMEISPRALMSPSYVGWIHNSYVVRSEFDSIDAAILWSVTPDKKRVTDTMVAPFSIKFGNALEAFEWTDEQTGVGVNESKKDLSDECFEIAKGAGQDLGCSAVSHRYSGVLAWVNYEDMMFTIVPNKESVIIGCNVLDPDLPEEEIGQPTSPAIDHSWSIPVGHRADMITDAVTFIDWCSRVRKELVEAASDNPGWRVNKFSLESGRKTVKVQNNGTCLATEGFKREEFHSVAEAVAFLSAVNENMAPKRRYR